MTNNPYDWAHTYTGNGFYGPLPLPYKQKSPPPSGYTGRSAKYPSEFEIEAWRRNKGTKAKGAEGVTGAFIVPPIGGVVRGPCNIALRLGDVGGFVPKGEKPCGWELIGLDIDHYGDKRGADQLHKLEQDLGNLPATIQSSARWQTRPDSYTALYLVPVGYRFVGQAATNIDVIQKAHRYLLVYPSVHPDAETASDVPGVAEAGIYRWRRPDGAYYDEAGEPAGNCGVGGAGTPGLAGAPDPSLLPSLRDVAVLPEAWLDFLTKGFIAETEDARSELPLDELMDWAVEHFADSTGDPCYFMNMQLGKQITKIDPANLHESAKNAIHELVMLGAESHGGWLTAINKYANAWFKVVKQTDKRGVDDALAEVNRLVTGAIAKVEPNFTELPHKCTGNKTSSCRPGAASAGESAGAVGAANAADYDVDGFKLNFAEVDDPDGRIAAGDHGGLGPVIGPMAKMDTDPSKYDRNDRGNARHLVDIFTDNLLYVEARKGWVVWDGIRWHNDTKLAWQAFDVVSRRLREAALAMPAVAKDEIAARRAALNWATQCGNASRIKSSLEVMTTLPGVACDSAFDAQTHLLGCANGILDLNGLVGHETRVRPPMREDFVTYNTNVDYIEWGSQEMYDGGYEDQFRLWQEYLELFLPDPEYRRFVQKALGHMLPGGNPDKLMLFLYGPRSTGKSTILGAIEGALGEYYGTVSPKLFRSGATFNPTLVDSIPCRVVGMSEIGEVLDGEQIKRLTGNDPISVEMKFSNKPFVAVPQFTPIVALNVIPDIRHADEVLMKRVLVLPFETSIPDGLVDPNKQIALRHAGVAVLSWLVEGLRMYQEEKMPRRTWPGVVCEVVGDLVSNLNPLQQFIDENVEFAVKTPEGRLAYEEAARKAAKRNKTKIGVADWAVEWTPIASAVYQLYERWCVTVGQKPEPMENLTRALNLGRPENRTVEGKQSRRYMGMRLLT